MSLSESITELGVSNYPTKITITNQYAHNVINKNRLILASSSKYRQILLKQIGLEPQCIAPEIDENPLSHELPEATALRLAISKARNVAATSPNAIIIGSDQVAAMGHVRLGKPCNYDRAFEQLTQMSGQEVNFYTALCVLDTKSQYIDHTCVTTTVRFRALDAASIDRYLRLDEPWDCAGSAKIESLGITLAEQVRSTDPSALIGLPLISLTTMLVKLGIQIP